VCGRLVERGLLTPDEPVTVYLPELVGTSWDGCAVRHLLDMRAGTRFNEDYSNLDADVRVYEQIYLWRPRTSRDLPTDITTYYATLPNERPHGGRFDYRSILTDLLAWVMERAAGVRFADLVASELWAPMGAGDDAEVTVDGHGNAMADGGVSCTLRDLARFGLLLLRDGRRGSEQVIPRAWIQDTLTAHPDVLTAFAAAPDAPEFPVGAYYRNQFWVIDPRGPIVMASGINGQAVLIHGPADVVIAKFSTWPVAWTPAFGITTRTGLIDLAERVAS
jgi:CubicO group peptidase (beta-lactamase class C family)